MFETGIKEVIKLPEENYFSQGPINDIHLMGYPLGLETPGGGFIYQMRDNRVAIGFLTALCYEDPRIDPYEAFIKFKRHPFVAQIIAGGKVVEQGARTVSSGGSTACRAWPSMVPSSLVARPPCRICPALKGDSPVHEIGHAGGRNDHGGPDPR